MDVAAQPAQSQDLVAHAQQMQAGAQQLQARQVYQQSTPLTQVIDWVLANPSVPVSIRTQFHVLWENVVLGNFNDVDRQLLFLKFREWCTLYKWHIPDTEWSQEIEFDEGGKNVYYDLSLMLSMLEQAYYIQLTRGKDAITLKELTTLRSIQKVETQEQPKKKSWW